MLPIQLRTGCQAHGQKGVGTAGDQARTVPGLSLVRGLQTGLQFQSAWKGEFWGPGGCKGAIDELDG